MLTRLVFARVSSSIYDGTTEDSVDYTGTIVLATENATRVVTLLEPGWVVDREIDHVDTADPTEFASAIWELVREEYSIFIDNQAPDLDYTVN
ncbi:MAG: hypothetical protein U5K37_06375 [Natrialbaceae archaeon]|nr:hypothetical protein [Natrialbaceae archaeon]